MNNKIIIGVFILVSGTLADAGFLGNIVQDVADVGSAAVQGAANVTEDVLAAPGEIVRGDRYYYGPRGERIYYEPTTRVYRRPIGYNPVVEEEVVEE